MGEPTISGTHECHVPDSHPIADTLIAGPTVFENVATSDYANFDMGDHGTLVDKSSSVDRSHDHLSETTGSTARATSMASTESVAVPFPTSSKKKHSKAPVAINTAI